jgi:hypothetical protein
MKFRKIVHGFVFGGANEHSWHVTAYLKTEVADSNPDEDIGLFFNRPKPSSLAMALGSTWVPGIFLWVKGGRRVKLTTSPPSVSRLSRENVGASTSHNPMGLYGLLQGQLYCFLLTWGIQVFPKIQVCNTEWATSVESIHLKATSKLQRFILSAELVRSVDGAFRMLAEPYESFGQCVLVSIFVVVLRPSIFFTFLRVGVRLSPLCTSATNWPTSLGW